MDWAPQPVASLFCHLSTTYTLFDRW